MSVGPRCSSPEDAGDDAARDESEWLAARAADDGDVAAALAPPAGSNGGVGRQMEQMQDEPAVLGDTCPICLQTLEAPVMLRACFHVFCGACLRAWTASAALLGVRPPPCPLCKTRFDAAYANVRSETDFDVVYFDGRRASEEDRDTGARARRERRAIVYRRRLRLARVNGVDVDIDQSSYPAMVKMRGEFEPWLERELHACIGRDVDLTVLIAIVGCCLDKMPRFSARACYSELETALAPFLYEDTELFVRELAAFLASRLNVEAYDDAVEYRCSSSSGECSAELCPYHQQEEAGHDR